MRLRPGKDLGPKFIVGKTMGETMDRAGNSGENHPQRANRIVHVHTSTSAR